MKVAIYARVSKEDVNNEGRLQDPENQIRPLKEFANSMNYELKYIFIDRMSGGVSNRPEFQKMLSEVRQRHIDLILVWSLDRFSREGIINTLKYIRELKAYKCALKSIQESWLDTSQEGIGELLISIFAWVAEQERKRISERSKAGLAKRRAQGQVLGRPKGWKPGMSYKELLYTKDRGGQKVPSQNS